MIKKLLFTGFLGIFSSSLFGQIMYGEYDLYMYSGRFSNPALSGVKEFGTSLGYQAQHFRFESYAYTYPLTSHQIELGQSLFKGRGGLELQWNHTEDAPYMQRNSGALAYSHGFRLGNKFILRAGLRGRLYSHILGDFTNWITPGVWGTGPDPVYIPPGNDLQFSWDAGLSLHHKQGYFALGSYHHNLITLKETDGIRFFIQSPVYTGELGAIFSLPSRKENKWKWSIQPFVKGYMLDNYTFMSFGSFVNYGPFQTGVMATTGSSMRIAAGLNYRFLRLTYSYSGRYMALSGINRYSNVPNHELGLRFILSGKDKEGNFMKNVYRGF